MKKKALRVFKTAWFTKKAKSAGISDAELCKAARELNDGQGTRLQKKLARDYGAAKPADIDGMLKAKELVEIGNG